MSELLQTMFLVKYKKTIDNTFINKYTKQVCVAMHIFDACFQKSG